jgi:hypothetical protein
MFFLFHFKPNGFFMDFCLCFILAHQYRDIHCISEHKIDRNYQREANSKE